MSKSPSHDMRPSPLVSRARMASRLGAGRSVESNYLLNASHLHEVMNSSSARYRGSRACTSKITTFHHQLNAIFAEVSGSRRSPTLPGVRSARTRRERLKADYYINLRQGADSAESWDFSFTWSHLRAQAVGGWGCGG